MISSLPWCGGVATLRGSAREGAAFYHSLMSSGLSPSRAAEALIGYDFGDGAGPPPGWNAEDDPLCVVFSRWTKARKDELRTQMIRLAAEERDEDRRGRRGAPKNVSGVPDP